MSLFTIQLYRLLLYLLKAMLLDKALGPFSIKRLHLSAFEGVLLEQSIGYILEHSKRQ